MKMNVLKPAALVTGLLLLGACSKSPEPEQSSSLFGNYDQSALLNNLGNNVLQARINTLSSNAGTLVSATATFTENPSNSSLTAAQQAWENFAQDWAAIAPFNFGPMNEQLISANVDNWPANTAKIESAINNQSVADVVGADTKGLKGLEYLLFDAQGNDAVIAKYTNEGSENRKVFVNSVAANLASQATALQKSWNDGYLSAFTSAKGNDVSSSVSQLVNAISLYLDVVKNMKIGNTIGLGIKINDNQSHPDQIEYKVDEISIAAMKANVEAMKIAFDGESGQGLDDLLDYLKAQKDGKQLSAVIEAQFDTIIAEIDALHPPYAQAVVSQKEQLQGIFNDLKTLIAYFKVDAANNLGVTITFSDTDGD